MRKAILIIFGIVILVSCRTNSGSAGDVSSTPSKSLETVDVQNAVVAGAFYPGNRAELEKMIKGFLDGAKAKPVKDDILGVMVPHAGYRFSGPVAAYAFKELEGRQYDYVVVMAPSHHKNIKGASIRLAKYYETPLGKIPIALDEAKRMVKKYDFIVDDPAAYEKEHALEVELPFLEAALKDFKLLPLIIGTHDADIIANIASALNEEFIGKKTLFVASSDLSHYHSYSDAVNMDERTLKFITGEKWDELTKDLFDGKCEMCGFAPVMVLADIYRMRGGGRIELLKYANSGDTYGDKARVVGYGSVAFVSSFNLSEKEKGELLRIARGTLVDFLDGKKVGNPKVDDSYLMKNGAPFVTLKKGGELRGCIGHIIAREPLAVAVQKNAIAAASEDPRFEPVKKPELKNISIEISVLTPPQRVYDPNTVQLGRDGLIIESGMHRGVLLPQVPGEAGWNLEQYLSGICRKAGLPSDALYDPRTRLYRFQALVFHEPDVR